MSAGSQILSTGASKSRKGCRNRFRRRRRLRQGGVLMKAGQAQSRLARVHRRPEKNLDPPIGMEKGSCRPDMLYRRIAVRLPLSEGATRARGRLGLPSQNPRTRWQRLFPWCSLSPLDPTFADSGADTAVIGTRVPYFKSRSTWLYHARRWHLAAEARAPLNARSVYRFINGVSGVRSQAFRAMSCSMTSRSVRLSLVW
jgi:hypothetical protein